TRWCRHRAPRRPGRDRFGYLPPRGRAASSYRRDVRKVAPDPEELAVSAEAVAFDHAALHRSVDDLRRARGERDVGDGLGAEEHEITCSRLFHPSAEHGLLIRVARQGHPVQTVHLLYQ